MRLGLCAACRGRLRPPAPGCGRCGRPLSGAALPEGFCCGRCRIRPPALSRLSAAFSYEPPLDAALRAFKFGRLDYLGRHVAEEILGRCRDRLEAIDVVVPVPLHWWRRWRRGFNQAELIAEPLAAALGLPCHPALRRRRATPPQAGLPRAARLANLRDAFRVPAPGEIAGRRLLLVDDVATTGTTLEAAARALLDAGGSRVEAVVAARTPEPVPRGGRGSRDGPVLGRRQGADPRSLAALALELARLLKSWRSQMRTFDSPQVQDYTDHLNVCRIPTCHDCGEDRRI